MGSSSGTHILLKFLAFLLLIIILIASSFDGVWDFTSRQFPQRNRLGLGLGLGLGLRLRLGLIQQEPFPVASIIPLVSESKHRQH